LLGKKSETGLVMHFRTVLLAAVLAAIATSAFAREVVQFSGYPAGTIVVKTNERRLYLATGDGHAIRYPVGVGRAGMAWTGEGVINGKFIRPAWSPPEMIRQENPSIPDVIPGGSPSNPMGAAAMTLSVDEYAIHGTNSPSSVGKFVSHGCIRMYNADIMDLYHRVGVGTAVVVLR
jgi:lipoprotein-anchoring transpeptidase ErfK/SrfK